MKKIILLLTLIAFSYSGEQWEYLLGEFSSKNGFLIIGLTDNKDKLFNMYTTLIEEGDKDASFYTRVALSTALNKMGEDGWELINIEETELNPAKNQKEIKNPRLEKVFYFKRRKP